MMPIALLGMLALVLSPGAPTAQRGALPVNGGRIAYEVSGHGPAIVLIHADIADMTMWDEQFRALSRHFRVVRYDRRGFGDSLTRSVSYSNRADLLALMNHLNIRKAVIVGSSHGGQIAVDFALEHPSRVSGVVSAAGGLSGFEHTPSNINKNDTARENAAFDRIDSLFKKKELEKAAALEADVWASGPEQPLDRAPARVRARIREMILRNARLNSTKPRPVPLDPPAALRLDELKVPVLVMIGDKDESVTRTMASYLAEHAPLARKIVFRNTAHMISMEHPREFTHDVSEFAQKISKATPATGARDSDEPLAPTREGGRRGARSRRLSDSRSVGGRRLSSRLSADGRLCRRTVLASGDAVPGIA